MGIILLLSQLVMHQGETVIVKQYGKKYSFGGFFFNAIICLFSMLYFFISDTGGLAFPAGIWGYGLANSVMYATGFYCAFVAFREGSFGITKLISSFASIISTLYGMIFLEEPVTYFTMIALMLIIVSIVLVNYSGKSSKGTVKVTGKWVVSLILNLVANAGITIIGRIQFNEFGNTYKNEYLIISLGGAVIFLLTLGLILERDRLKPVIKSGFLYGASAGLLNGIKNVFHLMVYEYMPLSVYGPLSSGIGMTMTFLVSTLIYKERYSLRQTIGVIVGVAAVVIISL